MDEDDDEQTAADEGLEVSCTGIACCSRLYQSGPNASELHVRRLHEVVWMLATKKSRLKGQGQVPVSTVNEGHLSASDVQSSGELPAKHAQYRHASVAVR
jgi:hypothetical protein